MLSHYAKLLVSEVLLICNLQEYLSFWKAHFALDEKQNNISFTVFRTFKAFQIDRKLQFAPRSQSGIKRNRKFIQIIFQFSFIPAMSLLSE